MGDAILYTINGFEIRPYDVVQVLLDGTWTDYATIRTRADVHAAIALVRGEVAVSVGRERFRVLLGPGLRASRVINAGDITERATTARTRKDGGA